MNDTSVTSLHHCVSDIQQTPCGIQVNCTYSVKVLGPMTNDLL